MSSISEFKDKINKISPNSATFAGEVRSVPRLSSGSLELDVALGGGYPRGRFILTYGGESSGKSYLALLGASIAQHSCMTCNLPSDICKCKEKRLGNVLYCDAEGTFDLPWAKTVGFIPEQALVFTPDSGEEGTDIINQAILENLFDVIILDSIAQFVPQKELDKSAEDAMMGDHAKLMARAFRKWQSSMNEVSKTGTAPMFFLINQPRSKFVMYGDNMTLPSGNAQHFYSSIKIRTKSQKVEDVKNIASNAYQEISGTIAKNKTYRPKEEFTFHLALRDYDCYRKGQINNAESIVKYGRRNGWVKNSRSMWYFEYVSGKDQKKIEGEGKEGLIRELDKNPEAFSLGYKRVLEEEIGGIQPVQS